MCSAERERDDDQHVDIDTVAFVTSVAFVDSSVFTFGTFDIEDKQVFVVEVVAYEEESSRETHDDEPDVGVVWLKMLPIHSSVDKFTVE